MISYTNRNETIRNKRRLSRPVTTEAKNNERSMKAMSVPIKELSPGTLLVTTRHELYAYLGYYEEKPNGHSHDAPKEGYLYLHIGNTGQYLGLVKPIIIQKAVNETKAILDSGTAYNACHLKNPKRFLSVFTRIPRKEFERLDTEHVFGMSRIGDRKPVEDKTNATTKGTCDVFPTDRILKTYHCYKASPEAKAAIAGFLSSLTGLPMDSITKPKTEGTT